MGRVKSDKKLGRPVVDKTRKDIATRFQPKNVAQKTARSLTGIERKVFNMSPLIYRRYLMQVLSMPVNELQKLASQEYETCTVTSMHLMVAKATWVTLQSGDIYRVDYYMSRLVGKMSENVTEQVRSKYDHLGLDELEAQYKKLIAENKLNLAECEASDWFKNRELLAIDVTPKPKNEAPIDEGPEEPLS
jgi:hypothetical protein